MGLFNIFKNKPDQLETEERGFYDYVSYNPIGGAYSQNKSLLLSTVYRCVDVISDAVAQLPLEPYLMDSQGYKTKFTTHPSYKLLNREPNEKMTRFTFMKTLVISILLTGNGYAWIKRDPKGNAISLQFINAGNVRVSEDKNGKLFYAITGLKATIPASDMVHILNFSYDGINGISTLQNARLTLGLATDSESHAAGFFKGGANLAGILKFQSSITDEQKKKVKSAWQMAFSPSSGCPNGIAILEGNMEFFPITVNPADAQLLETRKFNVVDICRFFGVSPVKAFDLSNSSYSTVEATQLSFLTDTLAPLLEKIELEFERKLYNPAEADKIDVRFDTSVLLRADKAAMASYYSQLFNMGVMSPNEIRRELDLPAIENGETAFVQVNVQPIKKALMEDPSEIIKAEE